MGFAPTRPIPPPGARNLVIVILDSLRYDSWTTAAPPNLATLGPVERRFSYASWTAPSHYKPADGCCCRTRARPTSTPTEYYKQDFRRYSDRLGVEGVEFAKMLPSLFLPSYLRNVLGYSTRVLVSMPVLNPHTAVNRDFDSYELMPAHNDMAAMLPRLRFDPERPNFYLLNVGETRYPYALPEEDPTRWPRISGVHGVFNQLDVAGHPDAAREFFDQAKLSELRTRQIAAVGYLDTVFASLFNAPRRHLADRHIRARGVVRQGKNVRPRPDHAREGLRGPVRRGPGAVRLTAPRRSRKRKPGSGSIHRASGPRADGAGVNLLGDVEGALEVEFGGTVAGGGGGVATEGESVAEGTGQVLAATAGRGRDRRGPRGHRLERQQPRRSSHWTGNSSASAAAIAAPTRSRPQCENSTRSPSRRDAISRSSAAR